jgi:hypothetical protein
LPLSQYINRIFDFEPGKDLEAEPVFSVANMDEKADFDD